MDWRLLKFVKTIDHSLDSRSLNPLGAEIVAGRFLKSCGIGVPEEIRAANFEEAASAGPDWICKTMRGGRLRLGAGEQNILIRRIPNTINLRELFERYGVSTGCTQWQLDPDNGELSGENRQVLRQFLQNANLLIGVGNASTYRATYFIPPADGDWTAIREAIKWNGEKMLTVHAARCLLGISAAHAGNVLVDATGKLYSIDHELTVKTDFSEFKYLTASVRRNTRAWGALEVVTSVNEDAFEQMFDDLPAGISWPLGSKEQTVSYFSLRLAHWRANMELADARAA
jgi:hypothetical protein